MDVKTEAIKLGLSTPNLVEILRRKGVSVFRTGKFGGFECDTEKAIPVIEELIERRIIKESLPKKQKREDWKPQNPDDYYTSLQISKLFSRSGGYMLQFLNEFNVPFKTDKINRRYYLKKDIEDFIPKYQEKYGKRK
jgi:hypothetical protein